MDIIQRLEEAIAPSLQHKGYHIIRTQLSGNQRRTLQIMIERADDQPITIEDCSVASRLVAVLLDVENIIEGPYTLEMSSGGLERPLVKIQDYHRFVGNKVLIKTMTAIGNRKTFLGKLESATETAITILLDEPDPSDSAEINIPYSDIRSARLHVEF